MSAFDVIVRGGVVVTPDGPRPADVGIEDGRIAALEPDLQGTAAREVDARGRHVLPGVIDAHVHLNEPGRTDWEGWATGTAALAAGGATCAIEMPLNARPPTVDGAAFDLKARAAAGQALVDFALWGGLVPGPLERLDELAARGVAGIKAFMSASGTDDFPRCGEDVLWEGMARAARLGLLVGVHAESDAITAALAARARRAGRTSMRDYLDSRPAVAEQQAIATAIALAEDTGCALHVVHVSTGRGVAMVAEARARGADVTCETCPHYLVLTDEDAERLGAVAKCAPPLRPAAERDALWAAIEDGTLEIIASDHSPAPPALKQGDDLFAAWGGIAGAQTLLPLLLSEGVHAHSVPLERVAALTAASVARRFALPGKGRLEPGADADLAIADLDETSTLDESDLRQRHPLSPFTGRRLRGRVTATLVRGAVAYEDGRLGRPAGRLVTPARAR